MLRFLEWSNHTLFFYYLASNGIYFLLLLIAIRKNISHRHRLGSIRLEHYQESPFTPPISLLVPAHNEEDGIGRTVRAVLPQLQAGDRLVVIADNCSDRTAETARSLGATVMERQDLVKRGLNCRGIL